MESDGLTAAGRRAYDEAVRVLEDAPRISAEDAIAAARTGSAQSRSKGR